MLIRSFLLTTLFIATPTQTGFIAGTLVKTPTGYVAIETLRVNDLVLCSNGISKNPVARKIIYTNTKLINAPAIITLYNEQITTTIRQRLYNPHAKRWFAVCCHIPYLVIPPRSMK
jgi:hypothetical protein